MRIHTDILTYSNLRDTVPSGLYAHITSHGSRQRNHAFEVILCVFEKDELHRLTRYKSGDYAATWDEWGIWIAALYTIDYNALIGHYKDPVDFEFQTMRYRDNVRAFRKPHTVVYRTHTAPWLED